MKRFFFRARGYSWPEDLPVGVLAALFAAIIVVLPGKAGNLLDSSFDPGQGANGFISAVARQTDGRIVVAGSFTDFNGVPRSRIARLNADGSLDLSFDPGSGADDMINAMAIQPDGKMVIGGFFTTIAGTNRSGIARLNPDGSLDRSFDPGTGAVDIYGHPQVHAVAVKPDGKIVLGGYFRTINGASRDGTAQLNPDGSVDYDFDPGTGLESFVALALAVQTNGQVLVAGIFERVNGVSHKSLARLNADGSVDNNFTTPNGGIGGSNALERVYAVAVQPDGKIIIGGDFTIVSGERRQHVARLNADGSLDGTFDAGIVYLERVSGLALQPDGRVVIGGALWSIDGVSRNGVARLMNDGSLDLGFDPGAGIAMPPFSTSDPSGEAVALQPDGRIILAGLFETFDGVARRNIARLERGSDTNLAIVNFAPSPVNGPVRENAGAATIVINRIGSHDGTTSIDYSTEDDTATAGADYSAQSGTVTFAAGERNKTISVPILNDTLPEDDEQFQVKLANPSSGAVLGSLSKLNETIMDDDSGVEFSAQTYSVSEIDKKVTITVRRVGPIQGPLMVDFATADGTATAGQDYTAGFGTLRFGRFLNDWERVKTFSIAILDDTVVEGNETILLSLSNPVGGILGTQNTASVVIEDNDFVAGAGRGANDAVQVILVLADGRALIAGDFTFVDGVARNRIARLSANTSLDTTFDPGLGADATVYALTLDADGKVLVAGSFTNINGIRRNGIARLNPDGSLDAAFDPGIGVQGSAHGIQASVRSVVVQSNGQILVGGFFSACGGLGRSGLARLNSDGSVDTTFNPFYGQDAVFPIALQPDGKILAGGYFTLSGLIVAFARLNPDGTVDESFALGTNQLVTAHVAGLALQSDGRILANGYFGDLPRVLRFNPNGSIDNTYDSSNVIAGYPNSIVLQSDGRLIVGGRAASVPGINPGGVTRLNPGGSLDTAFSPMIGPEGDVFAVAVQSTGTILLGGSFRTVNGLARYRIAQINADGHVIGPLELSTPTRMPGGHFRLMIDTPTTAGLVIEASSNLRDWVVVYTNTAPGPVDWSDTSAGQFGQRFYRALMRP